MIARMMTLHCRTPDGATLVGYVERHPINRRACAVLRFARTAAEVAWDGVHVSSLPRNWREITTYELVETR